MMCFTGLPTCNWLSWLDATVPRNNNIFICNHHRWDETMYYYCISFCIPQGSSNNVEFCHQPWPALEARSPVCKCVVLVLNSYAVPDVTWRSMDCLLYELIIIRGLYSSWSFVSVLNLHMLCPRQNLNNVDFFPLLCLPDYWIKLQTYYYLSTIKTCPSGTQSCKLKQMITLVLPSPGNCLLGR
jgi:hypothetical protein